MNPFNDVLSSDRTQAPINRSRRSTNPFDESDDHSCEIDNREVKTGVPEMSITKRNVVNQGVSSPKPPNNPFDDESDGSDEKSGGQFSIQKSKTGSTNTSPGIRPMSSARRKSSLLSGQEPIDVSTLKGDEKKLILMGVSIQAAQDALNEADGLRDSLKALVAATSTLSGKQGKLWAPPFQLRVTGSEVNSTSGKKPFTEYTVSGKPHTHSLQCNIPSDDSIDRTSHHNMPLWLTNAAVLDILIINIYLMLSYVHFTTCYSHAKRIQQQLCCEEKILSIL